LNAGAFSLETIRSWTCRFFPGVLGIPVQFARLFQSATGIIVFSKVAIATSMDAEKLMDYAESLLFVIGQT
jgi:hypothetical protein